MGKSTIMLAACILLIFSANAMQSDTLKHIARLEIGKKKKEIFSAGRDSSLTLVIDTLMMADRAQLQFFGKKKVKLKIGYAEIGNQVYISGNDGKNNGSDLDIDIHFGQLGSLYILAGGLDANNGTRTFPNGNGGDVRVQYAPEGVKPQSTDKKAEAYLLVDTRAGGYGVNPRTDLANIYSRIYMGGGRPLGQLPQGQVYSGSPGVDGKSTVESR